MPATVSTAHREWGPYPGGRDTGINDLALVGHCLAGVVDPNLSGLRNGLGI